MERHHDRQDRRRLGLVALEAADLQREISPVHEQADDDLGIDPALLGEADLAQLVLLLCLEVERGDVIEHQGQVTVRGGMGEAGRGDLVAVAPLLGSAQRAEHRAQRDMRHAQFTQHMAPVVRLTPAPTRPTPLHPHL